MLTLFARERILTAPYEERNSWELNLMYLGGAMYLEEHVTDQELAAK